MAHSTMLHVRVDDGIKTQATDALAAVRPLPFEVVDPDTDASGGLPNGVDRGRSGSPAPRSYRLPGSPPVRPSP